MATRAKPPADTLPDDEWRQPVQLVQQLVQPDELLEEDEPESSTDRVQAMLSEAGGDATAKIVLYRLPVGGKKLTWLDEMTPDTFEAGGLKIETLEATCVTVGNPHCVVFFETLKEADEKIHLWGPLLERHPAFPNRSNVQFVKVDNDKEISVRIWERGAGYTLASGSSSCAAAAACVKTGRTGRDLTVHMPGGDLSIKVSENFDLTMRGPVEEICLGHVSGELLNYLESHS